MSQVNSYDVNNSAYYAQQQLLDKKAQIAKAIQIPEYYNVNTEEKRDWREILKSNPITTIPYEFFLRGTEHPVATLLTWLGVSAGLDMYTKASSGRYEDSLLKQVANFGDRIQNSSIVQSKPSQFVLDGFKKIGKAVGYITKKSDIARAMRTTPSMPEWPIVKQEMLPHRLKVCEDFFKISETLHLTDDKTASLSDVVLGSKEKSALKKFFKVSSISEIPEEKAVNHVLLKQLGKTDAEIKTILDMGAGATEATKAEIRKSLNNISKETIKKAHQAISNGDMFGNHYKTVLDATKAAGGKVKIRAGHYSFLGPLSRPFERVLRCDEIYNKLWSISGGAKTETGRFLAKLTQMTHRGLTFGQGKLGLLLLIAPSLVEIGRDTIKAEPHQKIGTAVNGFVENISWVFTFPLALYMMHALGGIQYAGMSKKQVGEYRQIINEFNEKNKNGVFKTKAEYSKAKKAAKKLMKEKSTVKGQNIFTKGIRKFARLLTLDLETFKAYNGHNFFVKKFHQIPNFFKNCFGVPVRFGVWGIFSMFVLGGLLTKATTLVFGKAYDSMKHEENQENKKAQKRFLKEDLKERLQAAQINKIKNNSTATIQNPASLQGTQKISSKGHPQNMMTENNSENIDNYTYIPSSENTIPSPTGKGALDTYTYIPSSENKLQKDDAANPNKRRYVPSQAAANIAKTWDNSGLESALQRADKAEAKAMKILSGNFEQ